MYKTEFWALQLHLIVNHLSVVGWIGIAVLLIAHFVNSKLISRSLIYFLAIFCGVMTWATLFSGDEVIHFYAQNGIIDTLQPQLNEHEEAAEHYGWIGIFGGVVGMLGILVESRYPAWSKLFSGIFTGLVVVILIALIKIAMIGGTIRHEFI